MREMKDSGIEWVGEIPAQWKIQRNKTVFSCEKEIVGAASEQEQLLSLTTNGIRTKGKEVTGGKVPESFDTYQKVRPDNIVMCLFDLDCSAVFSGISPYEGMISPAYKVLSCKQQILPRYADYWFRFVFDGRKFKPYAKNLRYTLNYDEFAVLHIVLPTIYEQGSIAAFLDKECAEIDALINRTRDSIAEYKKLKQAVITQAVTKGVRGERPMKDSGVEWLGVIPEAWRVYRIANLYDERSENGLEELPILTVSINTGVSDYEIADEDKDRVFIRCEDRTKYKRVYPGDLTYNMMRAWQGAFGAVRVNGMVSPAYVVAKPKAGVQLDSRYMEALLRTQEAIEEMHRYSRGIVDFRLRLYWPEFKNIRICLPDLEEQTEIADYIDEKAAAIDKLIAQKEQFIIELQNYKKTLIYEYVTGKKEVPAERTDPVITFLDARALLVCRIVELMKPKGRIHLQKAMHMVDCLLGLNNETQYSRHKHGPYDVRIQEYEQAAEKKGWIKVKQGNSVEYSAGAKLEEYRDAYLSLYGDVDAEIQRICTFLAPMKTSQSERVATLLAAWNDFLLDGVTPTDQQLIQEVRTNWTPNKANSPEATWQDTLNKIRNNGFVPKGKGKHTITERLRECTYGPV